MYYDIEDHNPGLMRDLTYQHIELYQKEWEAREQAEQS
jgi:hypothetical protein